jgi:A/G-specific adenine glycosylase
VDDRATLLAWFEPRRSLYPWRGERDAYRVLVSEVMLQQTQVARIVPAYGRFLERFPDARALAAASKAEVIRAWGNLGYNRRAVALWNAARRVMRDHAGLFPSDTAALRDLPGVGPYTAAAVASLAFGAPEPTLDTNSRRVVARARLGREPHDVPPVELHAEAASWLDRRDPGSWNQALMDLGREACRPVPRCAACPLRASCRFRRSGRTASPARRRAERYEGSTREARGRVVAVLRTRPSSSLRGLAASTGIPLESVAAAVAGLVDDGLVAAGPAALAGRPGGRVRLGG